MAQQHHLYILLLGAICAETFATSCLNASQQFSRPLPTLGTVLGYCLSFYLLSQVLKYMPVGVAYAIWCGLGIILVAGIGFFVFHQRLDLAAIIGMGLIIVGVLVINLFSQTARH